MPMLIKVQNVVLGLFTALLVGVATPPVANAEAGPFWHHRGNSSEGNGIKLEGAALETFSGKGGPQELIGEIGTVRVRLETAGVKITGSIYDSKLQGQSKSEQKFPPIFILEPSLPGCQVEIVSRPGTHNTIFTEGHLAWTWNGEEAQRLEQPIVHQKPDLIVVPPGTQIQEGSTELPRGSFGEVKFSPVSACGALAGNVKVAGSDTGLPKPENVGEWSKSVTYRTPEGASKQHYWNGNNFIGVTTMLTFALNPASLIGEYTASATKQEIAVFEK